MSEKLSEMSSQGSEPQTSLNATSIHGSELVQRHGLLHDMSGGLCQRRLDARLLKAIEARDEEESDSDGDGGAAGAASPPRGPARSGCAHGGLKVSRVFRVGDRRS